jgi:starvation-inducible DNA-binding protein
MKPNIGITEKKLKQHTALLSTILASEMALYVKTRKAHWNVSGESFMELHKLYETEYKLLEASIDEVAERIGKLGSKTIGTMEEFLKLSIVQEQAGKYESSKHTLKELLDNHEKLIILLRGNIAECGEKSNDAGTADFLTGLMKEHETTAWILRRYLN